MKPFCGYNFADYWQHWLSFDNRAKKLPKVFHVNWFRKDDEGNFVWPGFGENMRVLEWIINRTKQKADAVRTPIGYTPTVDALNTNGLELSEDTMRDLHNVDPEAWSHEIEETGKFLRSFGDRLPQVLENERQEISVELSS